MTTTVTSTVNDILNRVGVEVGFDRISDPFQSGLPHYEQMKVLLEVSGEELALAHAWEFLIKEHAVVTDGIATSFPLPDDFYYMINQTGWERAENVPLFGPLSPQDWQYLLGRDLVSHTIYASFRIQEGVFKLFPSPAPANLDIHYEYVSKNWNQDGQQQGVLLDNIQSGADTPLYDRTLISRHLKMKYLESKGFDTTKAQDDFNQTFSFLTGKDKGAEILSAGKNNKGFPYLDSRYNMPDTNYGNP